MSTRPYSAGRAHYLTPYCRYSLREGHLHPLEPVRTSPAGGWSPARERENGEGRSQYSLCGLWVSGGPPARGLCWWCWRQVMCCDGPFRPPDLLINSSSVKVQTHSRQSGQQDPTKISSSTKQQHPFEAPGFHCDQSTEDARIAITDLPPCAVESPHIWSKSPIPSRIPYFCTPRTLGAQPSTNIPRAAVPHTITQVYSVAKS